MKCDKFDKCTKTDCGMCDRKNKLDYKVINRGNCMLCGKELTEGLFFCEECEQKGGKDCMDEDAKQASIPYTYNAPQHDWKCGYPDITGGIK